MALVIPPVPVQAPLAAWIDQPVTGQRFQDIQPRGSLAAWRQAAPPEGTELQLLPEIERQPAGSPLPRTVEPELLQAYLHRFARRRRRTVLGEQGSLRRPPRSLAESFKRLAPRRLLPAADAAQIQDLPLNGLAAAHAAVLNHAPVTVLLAVLDSLLRP